jgi:stage II sporulation protein D
MDDSLLVSIELMPIKKVRELIIKSNLNCSFKIKPTEPALPQRNLENTISIISKNCFLYINNEVDLDNYVAGVVEAEVGSKQPFEYYKVQATICRTYVLAHLRKHEKDGFNMCDKEHCQVFKGKSLSNIEIINAVQETSNSVLVDENLNLTVAAFHSNCGGQTVSSADVWNKAQSYLQPVRDTFCINARNAHWEKEVNKKIWIKYLRKKIPQLDSTSLIRNYNFAQPQRIRDFIVRDIKIPLKEIRSDFNLKSTYFSVEDAGETLIFKGKGFGHGIGLCQEGAIRMAKTGYSYSDIIHYYFKNVNIVNLNSLYFFKDVE